MTKKSGEKLYLRVFRQVRAYILQNNLQPGDLLPTEQALVEMLGVSRNVLREAIKSMELLGMVSAQPGRGTILKAFNLDFVFQNVLFAAAGEEDYAISEMLDIRKRLELGYMRQAFNSLDKDDIVRIRSIMGEIHEAFDEGHLFHDRDKAFHMAIFSKVPNKTLLSVLEAIWDVDENFKTEEKAKYLDEDTVLKHENIIRALENGNEEAFEAAMMAHFASGKYRSNSANFAEY
ncbi:MAG: FadR/GntR family transcriptional regulator [Bacillota bacterium]|nr:FadR/GntR family transcriptional regulator [Bacillota bacterium]